MRYSVISPCNYVNMYDAYYYFVQKKLNHQPVYMYQTANTNNSQILKQHHPKYTIQANNKLNKTNNIRILHINITGNNYNQHQEINQLAHIVQPEIITV